MFSLRPWEEIMIHETREAESSAERHVRTHAANDQQRCNLLDIGGPLTAREREHVALVARGLSNKQIARELGITDGTVKIHLHHVFRKLRVRNRTVLLRLAYDHGWRIGA
jgi:DNA-binding NarL/FixJ family response regulator